MGKGLIGQCELLEWRMLGVLKDGSRASRVGEKLKMLADRCYVSIVCSTGSGILMDPSPVSE